MQIIDGDQKDDFPLWDVYIKKIPIEETNIFLVVGNCYSTE